MGRARSAGKLRRERPLKRRHHATRRRLTVRFRRLAERGKAKNKVVIAVARELVGFMWVALREDRQPARHRVRTSTQASGAAMSAAPRSNARRTKKFSKIEAGQRREARKEKRAT